MVASDKQSLTQQGWAAGSHKRPSLDGKRFCAVVCVVLLAILLVTTMAGCSSNGEAAPNTAGTTVAGQTVTPQTGAPTGTPPTDANGQITPPSGGMPILGSSTTTTAAAASADSTTTTLAPTTTTTLADGQYSDGIYLAGTDIDTGLYHGTVNGDKGHWEISSDANGDKFVAGGDPTGPFYVKVKSGQYLRLSDVVIKAASTTAADPLATSGLTDGTYRVGYDIEAGWYDGAVNGGMGYWEISSDANGTSIVANDYPLGPFSLKVKDGQYLTLRGVTASQ